MCPGCFRSDNGSEFINSEFVDLLDRLGIFPRVHACRLSEAQRRALEEGCGNPGRDDGVMSGGPRLFGGAKLPSTEPQG